MICKFVKSTECVFNFMNLDDSKLILKKHLYPSKCDNHLSGDWFWLNVNMKITLNNE